MEAGHKAFSTSMKHFFFFFSFHFFFFLYTYIFKTEVESRVDPTFSTLQPKRTEYTSWTHHDPEMHRYMKSYNNNTVTSNKESRESKEANATTSRNWISNTSLVWGNMGEMHKWMEWGMTRSLDASNDKWMEKCMRQVKKWTKDKVISEVNENVVIITRVRISEWRMTPLCNTPNKTHEWPCI